MTTIRLAPVLVFGALAFALLAALGGSSRSAHAQDGPILTVTKECEWESPPALPAPTGSFDLFLDVFLDLDAVVFDDGDEVTLEDLIDDLGLNDVADDDSLPLGEIDCGEEDEFDLTDDDEVLETLQALVLAALLDDLGAEEDIDFDVQLTEGPVNVVTDVAVDCDAADLLGGNALLNSLEDYFEDLEDADGGDFEDLVEFIVFLVDDDPDEVIDGLDLALLELEAECEITNTFSRDDARITVNKVCIGGSGSFPIIVRDSATGLAVDGNSLGCGGSLAVDVAPGTYTIEELAADASFTTGITCNGLTTVGTTASVTVDDGENVFCTVRNVFGGTPGIVITNTNINTIDNTNLNDNNNENTNTQTQSNEQTQVNDNNQTTDVDSGPSVNISGAGAAAGPTPPITHVTGPSTGDGLFVAPPSTGEAGFTDAGRWLTWSSDQPWVILIVVAGALALSGAMWFSRVGN